MTWMDDDGPHRKKAAGSMMLGRWYDNIGTPKGFTICVQARRHYALFVNRGSSKANALVFPVFDPVARDSDTHQTVVHFIILEKRQTSLF